MDARKADEPARQVFGFVVEGKSPSPMQRNPLGEWEDSTRNTSPAPVRVPPPITQEPRVLNRSISNPVSHPGLASYLAGPAPGGPPIIQAVEPLSSSIGIRGASFASVLPHNLPLAAPKYAGITEPTVAEPPSDQQSSGSSSTTTTTTTISEATAPTPGPEQQPPPATQPPPPPQPGQAPQAFEKKPAKEMTKAERRELQEKQRAAKAAAKGGAKGPAGKAQDSGAAAKAPSSKPATKTERPTTPPKASPPKARSDGKPGPSTTAKSLKKLSGSSVKPSEMFAHLPPYRKLDIKELAARDNSAIHPSILELGLRYAEGSVKGSNARCVAMLNAICQVIEDYTTPQGKSLSRDLQSCINTQINFLVFCRPLGVSMGNAIRFLKLFISKIDPSTPEHQAKAHLIDIINNFIQEKVVVADRALVEHVVTTIHDGDVILTYSYSHVVLQALLAAHQRGKRFSVVVVDSSPEWEGKKAMKKLVALSVPCTYIGLENTPAIMKQVTTVFVGASAVLSNGTVLSQAGTATVAMIAEWNHKPVVVCCETYKFHERVQLDSIIHNELGNPDELVTSKDLEGWRDIGKLELLNLKYDALRKDCVTMVATEFGAIPASSVPVILREYRQDMVQV